MADQTPSPEELLQAASGFAPGAKDLLTAGDMIQPKKFTGQFVSPMWPEYGGQVVIRYPSMGDMLKIELLVGGGGTYHELYATLGVCVEKAPPTWYRLPPGAKEPVLAMENIQDSEGLVVLWREFLDWRRSFRRPASE